MAGFNKCKCPQQVHEVLIPARARAQAGHHNLVVAVALDQRVLPCTSPELAGQDNWQQLLHRDREGVGRVIPLDLEPPGAMPGVRWTAAINMWIRLYFFIYRGLCLFLLSWFVFYFMKFICHIFLIFHYVFLSNSIDP